MPRLELRDPRTGVTAWIRPDIGFNCFRFAVPMGDETVEVLDSLPGFEDGTDRPTRSGIPLLFPFPNRIAYGRFSWDGRDYQLPINHGDHAIHGFVFDRPWRLMHADAISVTGQFQFSLDAPDRRGLWPADFVLQVRYSIRDTALHSEITIRNVDRVPLPWGFGTHSYFKIPLSAASSAGQCLLKVPAAKAWELTANLPRGARGPVTTANDFREGRTLAGTAYDELLTGLDCSNGRVESVLMDPQAGLQVTQICDPAFREMIAFTPPHGRSACMEPYTCISDAINLHARGVDAGLGVLPPGGETRLWITIELSRVMA